MVSDSKFGTETPSQERRRFGRFATRLPIATSRESLAKRGQSRRPASCRIQIQDFSLGGVRAECSVPLKVDEQLTLRLPPIGCRPPAELTGRVIHCRRHENRYQIGIEFCHTRPDPMASPYHRLSTLFSLASQFPSDGRMADGLKDS